MHRSRQFCHRVSSAVPGVSLWGSEVCVRLGFVLTPTTHGSVISPSYPIVSSHNHLQALADRSRNAL